tara:strand:- start:7792 stop:7956 length:165 start_codon:yes stop_codon:yes gene_type:complete
MRFRIAYITVKGKFKNKNFEKRTEMDDYIFDRLDKMKRVRCMDKETKNTWSLQV